MLCFHKYFYQFVRSDVTFGEFALMIKKVKDPHFITTSNVLLEIEVLEARPSKIE